MTLLASPRVTLHLAEAPNRPLVRRLIELYCYDFSEYEGTDVDDQGRFGDEQTDAWLDEPGRTTWLFRFDGRWAGFAMVLDSCRYLRVPGSRSVAEFFVLRKYRRQGVGATAAKTIFDTHRGPWEVLQLQNNLRAQRFWRTVVSDYTDARFQELATGAPWVGLSFDNHLNPGVDFQPR